MLSGFSYILFSTLWTVAYQAPLSMGFSRQEYWSGLPCPPPGDLPDPGIEPTSPESPALQVESLPTEPPGKPLSAYTLLQIRSHLQVPGFRIWTCLLRKDTVEPTIFSEKHVQSTLQSWRTTVTNHPILLRTEWFPGGWGL